MPGDSARPTRLFALAPAQTATHRSGHGEPLSMHSAVMAAAPADQAGGLPEEWQTAMHLCRDPRAVAEIAAVLHIPLTTVVAMFSELVARGLVHHQAPLTEDDACDTNLLRKIRKGLEDL